MSKDIKIQIRFADLDGYAHVNNSVYLSYLEIARTETYKDAFLYSVEQKVLLVLIESNIKYKASILFQDDIYIKVSISEVTGLTFTFNYEIHNGLGKIFATAKTVHVLVNSVTHRPMRLTPEIKSFLLAEV